MSIELNEPALRHARALVRDGKVVRDERDDWSEAAPDRRRGERLHRARRLDRVLPLASRHRQDARTRETKGAYSFPFGDFRTRASVGRDLGGEPGRSVRPHRDPRRAARRCSTSSTRTSGLTTGPAASSRPAPPPVGCRVARRRCAPQSRARDVARQRPSMPSSRTATARVRAGPAHDDDRLDDAVGGRGVRAPTGSCASGASPGRRARCAPAPRGSRARRACGTGPR